MSRRGENIYKRKDGRWEGRYIKDRRPGGSIHYGYIYAKTYKEVRVKLLPLKQENPYVKRTVDGQSVKQWLNRWLNEQRDGLKPSTFSTYHYKLRKYVLPQIGYLTLGEMTSEHLQQVVDHWKEECGLSAATMINVFRILQNALTSAYKKGYTSKDICDEVVLPKKKKQRIRALSQEEQRTLEQEASTDAYGLPALLSLHTGLRIGEVAALTWENVDLTRQLLYVQQTYQRISTSLETEKKTMLLLSEAKTTSSQRMIPLSSKMVQLLKKAKEKKQGPFLFMRNDRPMEPRLINYHFKKIVEKAKLFNVHFHQLRHTFATRCMEVNGDIASISSLLGHSSAKTTLDVYVDSLDKQRKKIISDMEGLLNY